MVQWRIQDLLRGVRFKQGHQNAEGVKVWDTPPPKNFCWKRYILLDFHEL